jgi:hypothetical protein
MAVECTNYENYEFEIRGLCVNVFVLIRTNTLGRRLYYLFYLRSWSKVPAKKGIAIIPWLHWAGQDA